MKGVTYVVCIMKHDELLFLPKICTLSAKIMILIKS